jgi:hypothetical protein
MDDERPPRIEDLLGRALFLGTFRMCMPVDIFETGVWLAEHEQFADALDLAADFAASPNPYARFCFACALERRAGTGQNSEAVAAAAALFADDPDPYARKHARGALEALRRLI